MFRNQGIAHGCFIKSLGLVILPDAQKIIFQIVCIASPDGIPRISRTGARRPGWIRPGLFERYSGRPTNRTSRILIVFSSASNSGRSRPRNNGKDQKNQAPSTGKKITLPQEFHSPVTRSRMVTAPRYRAFR